MDELLDAARRARSRAVVPYSEYAVGAAIETVDGSVYTGANIEIANYSNSLHAEEVALARAVMEGHRDFERIAVASDANDGVTPCGMCRQTLAEFADGDFEVLVDHPDGPESHRLTDLLPHAFTGEQIHDHTNQE
ncbi:MAG: cytidine deaminase [Halodesulfurarchaeum sp.]|nr:cytidine deaminase [Halodesulfurarchaeum sp.]